MRISDWSSDVCSSDLGPVANAHAVYLDLERLYGHYSHFPLYCKVRMSAIHVPEWVGQLLEPLPRDEPANGAGDREDTWIDGFGRETAVLLRPLPRVLIFGRRPRIVRMGLVDPRRPPGIWLRSRYKRGLRSG